jgi:MipA family protein
VSCYLSGAAAAIKFRGGLEGGVMRRVGAGWWIWATAGLLGAALTVPAGAAEPARPAPTDWTLTLGVEGRLLPSYDGSDRYVLRPIPLINLRRAGTERKFSSARDGASLGILDTGNFRLGPTAKIKYPRRERDDTDLRGLGDVGWTLEAGVFAEYWVFNYLRTRVDIRQGFGGHHGVVGDLSADLVVPVTKQLTLSAGPRVTLVSAAANDPYFSINATQSAASGLPVYAASGGLQSYGVGAMARYEWSAQWATHFFLEYARLNGSAASSPLVTMRGSANQLQLGIGVAYSFDVPGLW